MPRARIAWATADPMGTERSIRAALGGRELVNATLEFTAPLAGDGPLDIEWRGVPGLGAVAGPVPILVGLGWATVDRERAAAELTDAIPGLVARGFVAAPRDPYLGAHVLIAAAAPPIPHSELPAGGRRMAEREVPPIRLTLLEPDTEGRLAAALARYGEGPVALYVARPGRGAGVEAGATSGPDGPFGPGRLIATADRFGPFLIVLHDGERLPSPA